MLMDSEEFEMVAATAVWFYKEMLIWYVITLKLGEILAAAASQPRLAISFREKLDKAEQDRTSWDNLCIYRAPRSLRDANYKAYDPRILSIGPYHRGKKGLTDMDRHKWRCLRQILKRTNQDASLYLDSIREIEVQARSCYDEPIDLTSDQFVEMMVLDGCFLLELFQSCSSDFEELGYSRYDPVFGMRGPWVLILGDIIKLENQLPLFILDRLLALQIGKPYKNGLVIRPILQLMGMNQMMYDPLLIKFKNCHHCLHIFRQSLLPLVDHKSRAKQKHRFIDFITKLRRVLHLIRLRSRSNETVNQSALKIIHCVTKLREAGIKLKTRESNCFLDIKFEDGVLKMPRLLFQESIKWEFPNLIAFEQCHLDCGNDITSYALFMDHLIDTSEDVGYLHNRGILEPSGGSYNEVADFFNRLCDQVMFTGYDSYLWEMSKKLAEQVDRHSRSKSCPFCRDSLKRVNSCDLWILADSREMVDTATLSRENRRRLFIYVEKLPLIVPDSVFDAYDSDIK